HFGAVHIGLFVGDGIEVFQENLVAIETQPGGHVVVGGLRHGAGLGVIRSAPCPAWSAVGADATSAAAPIGRHEHVGDELFIHAAAAIAAGSPLRRVPDFDDAVFIGADLDLDEAGRAAAGDLQLQIAIKHELDGPTRLLGDLRTDDAPFVG